MKTEEQIIQEYTDKQNKLSDRAVYEFYNTLRSELIQIDWYLDNDTIVSDIQMKMFTQRQNDVYWLAFSKRLPKTCEEYKTKTRKLLEKWNENKAKIAKLPWYKRIFI